MELHEIEKAANKYAISLLRIGGSAHVFDKAANDISAEILTN